MKPLLPTLLFCLVAVPAMADGHNFGFANRDIPERATKADIERLESSIKKEIRAERCSHSTNLRSNDETDEQWKRQLDSWQDYCDGK